MFRERFREPLDGLSFGAASALGFTLASALTRFWPLLTGPLVGAGSTLDWAVRLTRAPRKEYDVKVELWLAPGAAYAPVRLRLTQPNGDWVDQQWSSTDRG